jgi:hypothetical protein
MDFDLVDRRFDVCVLEEGGYLRNGEVREADRFR